MKRGKPNLGNTISLIVQKELQCKLRGGYVTKEK